MAEGNNRIVQLIYEDRGVVFYSHSGSVQKVAGNPKVLVFDEQVHRIPCVVEVHEGQTCFAIA